MVKAYLRYEPAAAFGVIVSPEANITYDSSGKYVLAPALETVGIWHVRQGLCIKSLSPQSSSPGAPLSVTSICSSHSSPQVASGYADGSIRVWDSDEGTSETVLNGHKGGVSALRYSKNDSLLASGGRDGDLILWDVIAETGRFRLRGHRGQVTDLVFFESDKKLISSSKDKFLRVWDLEAQQCVQILGVHRTEVWSIDIDPEESYVVTGSADPELRFFTINDSTRNPKTKFEILKPFGDVTRQSSERVATLRFNKTGTLLACQVSGKTTDLFRVLDARESKRKARRRVRRQKNADPTDDVVVVTAADVFKHLQVIRASKKACSFSFSPTPSSSPVSATVAMSLSNNTIEVFSVEGSASRRTSSIEIHGHRSDIRSVALSSDGSLLMSTSHDAVKIWNPTTGSCLRTVSSGFGLCCSFASSDRLAVVGTREGNLEIIDVGAATLVASVEAHGGPVQSIAAVPDGDTFVTGSEDHTVKFWKFQNDSPLSHTGTHPCVLSNLRTETMSGDVIAVCAGGSVIAVALLDNTVRVLFADSMKPFLSLYGHRLPVLCVDMSSDGELVVSGSSDKNMRIWGLDFGDCHRSIFAHSGSVTAVRFVRGTHYVFSVGKDRLVRYWDADRFELLLSLEGHHAEVWCLAVGARGDFVVTGSHDRSLRRWDRTDEPLFVDEEKERRLEELLEADADRPAQHGDVPDEGDVGYSGRSTRETVSAADSIIAALDLAEAEQDRISMHRERASGAFEGNVYMRGLSPSDYILESVSDVRTADLDQSLLALPFSDALKLMSYMSGWVCIPDKVELVCRMCTTLLQINHDQLVTTPSARPALALLKDSICPRIKEWKDIIGFNIAAMEHVKNLMEQRSDAPFRNAKAKVMEIRSKQVKRAELRKEERTERRRKKKRQKTDDHHHIVF